MNVSLTPKLEEFVRRKVAGGRYNNASEVVREALRLMDERERFEVLRAEVLAGYEELERGEGIPFTETLMEELRQAAIQASKEGHKVNPVVTP